MSRSRFRRVLTRDLVPKRLRPFRDPLTLALYCVAAAWCWTQTISHWRCGFGWFGIDVILAVGFTVAAFVGLRRLPAWLRSARLQRSRLAAEALLAAIQEGKCARCGYDLTGLASINCPECGAWIGRHHSVRELTTRADQ